MQVRAGRWRRGRLVAAALLALVLLAVAILWSQREPIARDAVERMLAARGVRAQYRISRFGLTSQTLENIVIGDPAAPDLVAKRAEVRLAIVAGWPRLRAVAAEGVRLRGRIVDGRLSLGSLDRLMPAPSGGPFTLPDLDVDLRDARMRLETPAGPVGLALSGSGNLSDGFDGRLAAVTRGFRFAGCEADGATAYVRVRVADREPSVSGPVRARRLICPSQQLRLADANLSIDASLTAALDHWRGDAQVGIGMLTQGSGRLDRLSGTVGFSGNARATSGSLSLAAANARMAPLARGRVELEAGWRLARRLTRLAGTLRLEEASLVPGTARSIAASRDMAVGTPLGPIWRQLASRVAATAGASADAEAELLLVQGRGGGGLRVAHARVQSATGASLRFGGGRGATYYWPSGQVRMEGTLRLAGGDMPATQVRVAQRPGGSFSGEARIAPLAAEGARLALAPIRFASVRGETRFATAATLDGPLADGRIEGLRVPVEGRVGARGLVVGERCVPLAFERLTIAGTTLGASRLPLCPSGRALLARGPDGRIGGGAAIVAPRLAGRIGSAPATFAATRLEVALGRPGFTVDGLEVRIGAGEAVTRLDAAALSGEFATGGLIGRFAGLGGNIGSVPLLLSEGSGDWRLENGILSLTGGLRVADRAATPRFRPLVGQDVRLRLAGSRVDATGQLVEPTGRARISDVTLAHDLASGTGHAVLDVPGITFGEALQPEALTPLTLGVVADVQGMVSGRGRIDWNAQGVTSGGRFRTDGLALAAAFGPVSGLKGEIEFSDLLGLVTPPGQEVALAEVNPGIAVTQGVVRYQLLKDQLVRIEGGRWPFSGGELILEPTTLDLGRPSERRLTFRIVGLDAAEFVQSFDLKNIALTGTFDGLLPMVFDARGGRIVGGRLEVRRGGGTLAYVGEISNADLGMFAKLAFDALKSMRYNALVVDLDGALDGELISRVLFNGTNETPKEARGGLLAQLTGLPFRFNITIRAPFRGLLNSMQSFNDPRGLIGQQLPDAAATSVQPKESETVP